MTSQDDWHIAQDCFVDLHRFLQIPIALIRMFLNILCLSSVSCVLTQALDRQAALQKQQEQINSLLTLL